MKKLINYQPKKILVIQQRQLGDVVVSTPIFSMLKKKFPQAHIALLTEEKCFPLVESDPHIDAFHIIKKNGFFEALRLYWNIFIKRYDVIISMQQLARCQIASLCSLAKFRLSFYPRYSYRKLLYNIYIDERNLSGYVADIRPHILKPLGIEPSYEKTCIYLSEEEKNAGLEILKSLGIGANGQFISIDATHKHDKNRWKHYKELIEMILEKYDYHIFLFRAPGEEVQLKEILAINSPRIIMPKNPLSIRQSMACLSYASFHIGNTSAPAHMATALNVPVLVVLARTENQWHCQPKWQYEGRARQLEVRPRDGAYEEYMAKINLHNEENEQKIAPDPQAHLNIIKPEQVLEEFDKLVEKPYY